MKGYKNTTKTVYETESSDYDSGYRSGKEFYSKSRVAPIMTPSEKGGVAGKLTRGATRAMVVKPMDAAVKALSYTGTLTDNDGTKASPAYVKGLLEARKDTVGYAKGGKAMAKVGKVMGEFKAGALHSGSKKGPAVTNRKQAIAIGLSEARKAGAKIPMRKAEGGVVEVDLPTRAEPLKAQGLSSPKLPRVDDSRDFSTAFREARSAGDKTFSWRGKTYTTQLASEARSAPKAAAAPAPKAAAAPAPKAAAAPAPKAPAPAPKAAAPAPAAKTPAPAPKQSIGQRAMNSSQTKEENDKEWADRFSRWGKTASDVKDYLAKGDPKYRGMSRKDAFRAAFRDSMAYAKGGAVKKAEGGKVKAPTPKAVSDADYELGRHMRLEYGPEWREKKVEPADYIGASKKARAFSGAMDSSYPEDKASMRTASDVLKERGVAEGDKVYQRLKKMYATRGYAEGGKVKAPPPKAKPYDPVKDEPTSRPLTADQVRNLRNQMKANPPKAPKRDADWYMRNETAMPGKFKKGGVVEKGSGEVYKSKAAMKRHEAAESPAKERSEHKQTGGLLGERESAAKAMVGKAKGGYVKGHKFGPKANLAPLISGHKFKNGGKVGC